MGIGLIIFSGKKNYGSCSKGLLLSGELIINVVRRVLVYVCRIAIRFDIAHGVYFFALAGIVVFMGRFHRFYNCKVLSFWTFMEVLYTWWGKGYRFV